MDRPDNILQFPKNKKPENGNGNGNGDNGNNGNPTNRDLQVERRLTHLEVESDHYSTKEEFQRMLTQVSEYERRIFGEMTSNSRWTIGIFITFGALVLTVVGLIVGFGFSAISEMLNNAMQASTSTYAVYLSRFSEF